MNSSLFKCPDCEKEVSRSVKVCPNCGNNKIQKQLRSKEWNEMDPSKKKKITYGLVVFLIIYIIFMISTKSNKPNACDCYNILNIPTERMIDDNGTRYGMPFPVNTLSNEEWKKYENCYEAYKGPAGAILECNNK
jgi:hypothetical protein